MNQLNNPLYYLPYWNLPFFNKSSQFPPPFNSPSLLSSFNGQMEKKDERITLAQDFFKNMMKDKFK